MTESSKGQTPYFNRETTDIIKGIALIMMFIHHTFTQPERWTEGISYPFLAGISPYFFKPFQLCVSVFCFLTGYFYFFHQDRSFKYSLKKISDFLISYWCVFFLCAAVSVLFAHHEYTLPGFIRECFAFETPTMVFCWYVNFYIFMMLAFPLTVRILSRNIHFDLLFCFILLKLGLYYLNELRHFLGIPLFSGAIGYLSGRFPMVLIGYVFACYGIFEKTESAVRRVIHNKTLFVCIMFLTALAVPMGRTFDPTATLTFQTLPALKISMDLIYAPVFMFALVSICKSVKFTGAKAVLAAVGRYSMLMWFLSCIFFNDCASFMQPILYFPRNPVLVIIWELALCYAVSRLLDTGIQKIRLAKNRLLFR